MKRFLLLRLLFVLIMLIAIFLPAGWATAQSGPQRVEVPASDGLILVGDLYIPAESGEIVPGLVLLHMAHSSRHSWEPIIPALTGAGYATLVIDLRGLGDTGGTEDWVLAEQDTQLWLDWFRQQPAIDPARVSLLGASFGANLALRGMANDEAVVTTIALSPALEYAGMTTEDAVERINKRPVFLAVAQDDSPCNKGVKTLSGLVKGQAVVRYYSGRAHGVSLLTKPDLIPMIVAWLDQFNKN